MEIDIEEERVRRPKDVSQMPDLAFLKDEKLNKNSAFREMRKVLEEHFQKPKCLHPQKSPQWNSVLYRSLLTCLRDASFSSDPEEQSALLEQVYTWYKKKTEEPFSPHKSNPGLRISPSPLPPTREKFKKSDFVRPVEGSSVSPARAGLHSPQAWVPSRESKPFVTTPQATSLTPANLIQRFHDFQARKVQELRSEMVNRRKLAGWSRGKSRMEEESTFITEQSIKISSRGNSPTHMTESSEWQKQTSPMFSIPSPLLVDLRSDYSTSKTPVTLTTEAAADRVARFRQRHAELLNVSEESPPRRLMHPSLSRYHPPHDTSSMDVHRPPTPSHTPIVHRSESRPVQPSSLSPLRRCRMVEIDEVKRKLAQNNLPCTFRVLKDGLMEPEGLPPNMLTPQNLPQGGELLQSNPFFVAKNKKKKIKRKK